MRILAGLCVVVLVTGCAKLPFFTPKDPAAEPGVAEAMMATDPDGLPEGQVPGDTAPPPAPSARTVEQFDTTTAQDRAEAAAAPAPEVTEVRLGTTIASLGDPADPGFWAETPLVTEVRQGRLEYSVTGKSVTLELRPSGGATGSGTRVSLPALRVLEAPLTALPELVVIGL